MKGTRGEGRTGAWWTGTGLAAVLAAGLLLLGGAGASGAAVAGDFPDDPLGDVVNERWPCGVPLGGIGCGHVEVMTDGSLGGVTINNNWDRPVGWVRGGFFAVYGRSGDRSHACLLRLGGKDEYSGVENVQEVRFRGLYPRAEASYEDERLPVSVRMHAWSSLVPGDADASAVPAAVFDLAVTNPGGQSADAALLFAWPNLIGFGGDRDTEWRDYSGNVQEPWQAGDLRGLRYATTAQWQGRQRNTWGEYVVCAQAGEGGEVEVLPLWDAAAKSPGLWAAFAREGRLVAGEPGRARRAEPAGAVAVRIPLGAGETRTVRFILAWFTPHLVTQHDESVGLGGSDSSSAGVEAAWDGDLTSRWSTGRPMRPGDGFELRLAEPAVVSGLVLDSSPSPNDWPRGLQVYLSGDGEHWDRVADLSEAEAEARQEAGELTVTFAPARVRAIRLRQKGETDYWWWSLHELRLLGEDGKALGMKGARATGVLKRVATRRVEEDAGHWYERRLKSAEDVARYVAGNAGRLLEGTREWQDLLLRSSLPSWLKLKLVNDVFSMYAATVLTRDGRFSVLESPRDMGGALGTMDQRMAAHAFYAQAFPELDKSELRLFAQCQRSDGRITHFCGNVHQAIGRADVGYGVTDWPDLSCSFVLQVVKLGQWLGDRSWLEEMWPHVRAAMEWLAGADKDGDLIPEGGSTYDYEQLPAGAFVYSASCYLGALLAAERCAEVLGESDQAGEYRRRFEAVQRSVMTGLWNGESFIKWNKPADRDCNPNSFVAALAGDWLARLSGLGDTLPPGIAEREVEQLIARHLLAFEPVPPMEVTPRGYIATGACFLLQHQPYLGCEAIYRGYTDQGLEVLRRVYEVGWVQNHVPWDQPLAFNAPGGERGGLRAYMTNPASWHVLNALSGASLNLFDGVLYLSPRLPEGAESLSMPVFLGSLWAWLDWEPGKRLALRVLRCAGERAPTIRSVAADGNGPPMALPEAFVAQEGAVLDLTGFEARLRPVARAQRATALRRPNDIGMGPAEWKVEARPDRAPYRASYALDREPATRWATGAPMAGGERITVDMGETREVGAVWMLLGAETKDWPRGLLVEVSFDGRRWIIVAELDAAASRACVEGPWWKLEMPGGRVKGRYLRLVQTGSEPGTWWGMHELYVLPAREEDR